MTKITIADQGKTVAAAVNQPVTVTLAGNPTTGYSWALQNAKEDLYSSTSQYNNQAPAGMVGGGGEYVFTITPKKSGSVPLEFIYWREFEGAKENDKKFTVTLNVA